MWLTVLRQITELLPHLRRLIPLLDTYFAARAATTASSNAHHEQHMAALSQFSENFKSDLAEAAKTNSILARQLTEQTNRIATELAALSDEMRQSRFAHDQRMEALEQKIKSLQNWFWLVLGLVLACLALMLAILLTK